VSFGGHVVRASACSWLLQRRRSKRATRSLCGWWVCWGLSDERVDVVVLSAFVFVSQGFVGKCELRHFCVSTR
jgi:hypothetical protein